MTLAEKGTLDLNSGGRTEHVEAETDVVGGGYREERLNGLCYEQTMEFREFDRLFIDDLIEGR